MDESSHRYGSAMGVRQAPGGGRWVDVDPVRLARWIEGFSGRHGEFTAAAVPAGWVLTAADGAVAELHTPPGMAPAPDLGAFVREAGAPRRLGLLLARKGAVAVGVADGPDLIVSKIDRHYVQGRTAAGGWSQQRFARRRDNQAKAAAADGADVVGRLLLPQVRTLTALVAGGDRSAVDTILAERSLAPVAALRTGRLLDVPEPRHAVLVAAIAQARSVLVLVTDPPPG
jgi:hypothetical protein